MQTATFTRENDARKVLFIFISHQLKKFASELMPLYFLLSKTTLQFAAKSRCLAMLILANIEPPRSSQVKNSPWLYLHARYKKKT